MSHQGSLADDDDDDLYDKYDNDDENEEQEKEYMDNDEKIEKLSVSVIVADICGIILDPVETTRTIIQL